MASTDSIRVSYSGYPNARKDDEYALHGKDKQSDGRADRRETFAIWQLLLSSVGFYGWEKRSTRMGSPPICPQLLYGFGKCEKSCLVFYEREGKSNGFPFLFLWKEPWLRMILKRPICAYVFLQYRQKYFNRRISPSTSP